MARQLQLQLGRVMVGVRFDTRDHLVGLELLTSRGEGRVFTLLIGASLLSLKLSLRER